MKNIRTGIIILALSFVFESCSKESSAPPPPSEIPVYEVKTSEVKVYAEFVGETYGYFDIAIRARVEGFLVGRHFQEGSVVEKGKLLYSIDPQPFLAMVAEQESRLAQAKTALVNKENDLKRVRPLAEKNAVSIRDLDAAVAGFEAATAEVEAAKASLRAANIELGYTRIYSPIKGIIGLTQAKVGDFVGRDPNPVVLNGVSRIDTILVRFAITETQFLNVMRYEDVRDSLYMEEENVSSQIGLRLADGSLFKYFGKVDFADRDFNPNTGTLTVQASFPNPDGFLRPGLFARVRILAQTDKNGIKIPLRCISEIQGIFQVLVVKEDNTLEVREVKVVKNMGNMAYLESGLNPGERIVLEGLQRTQPGMTIIPVATDFQEIEETI